MPLNRYTPVLGWSFSRYQVFNTCHRQYFYQYYTQYVEEALRKKVQIAKKTVSTPLIQGTVTHGVLEALLKRLQKSDIPIDFTKLRKYIIQLSTKEVESSKIPEIENMEVSRPEYISEMVSDVLALIRYLLDSNYFSSSIGSQSMEQRKLWSIEPHNTMQFDISGYKVYAILDFAYQLDDRLVIVDWKTGKPSQSYTKQLMVYALCESLRRSMPISEIECHGVYLRDMKKSFVTNFNTDEAEQMRSLIIESTQSMYSLLTDIEKNVPQNSTKFPKTTTYKNCRYCNFAKICWQENFQEIIKAE